MKSFLLSLSFIMVFLGVIMSFTGESLYILWELVLSGQSDFDIPFFLDKYSCLFGGVVSFVAFSVFTFSESYMLHDKFYVRFHSLVLLFVLSMYLLIFSPSMISIFLGWDGLGVVSYFLVIYFDSPKSYNAGLLTAMSNRIGDICFLLSLILFSSCSSWNFFNWNSSFSSGNLTSLLWILGVGCCTKSAQLPFSAWLPAAMAAPTPVSALVHSSTLVTAGVYVLFRLSFLLKNHSFSLLLFFLGSMTMVLAGMSALKEMDAKKIVALSTLSQLGIMMMTLGVKSFNMAFFHLLSHAFFKALLFMVVGNLIHMSFGYQDLRKMGCSSVMCKESLLIGSISNFSLMGLPFLSGFYSKDLCIEMGLMGQNNFFGKIIFLFGIVLTVLYSFRFSNLCFSGLNYQNSMFIQEKIKGSMGGPYYLLSLAVCGGGALSWMMFDEIGIFLDLSYKNFVFLVLIFSVLFNFYLSVGASKNHFFEGLFYMWNLPFISSWVFNLYALSLGKFNVYYLESKWLSSFSWSPGNYLLYFREINFSMINLFSGNLIFLTLGMLLFMIV